MPLPFNLNFFPDDAFDDLPAHPEEALLHLLEISYRQRVRLAEEHNEDPSSAFWRYVWAQALIAVAEELRIDMPNLAGNSTDHLRAFEVNLGMLVSKLRLRHRLGARVDTVSLGAATKRTIAEELDKLRGFINRAAISDALRASLHRKIDAVEAELSKGRSNLGPFERLSGALQFLGAGALAGVALFADMPDAVKCVGNISACVSAERKLEDERERHLSGTVLLTHEEPKRLTDLSHQIEP